MELRHVVEKLRREGAVLEVVGGGEFVAQDNSMGNFRRVRLSELDCSDSDFIQADFRRAVIEEVHFENCDLMGSDFQKAKLTLVNFACADLTGADLSNSDFAGADLTEVDFTGAKLDWCSFAGANLEGAMLWDVSTVNTNFNMARGVEISEIYAHVADTMRSRRVGQDFRPRCRK